VEHADAPAPLERPADLIKVAAAVDNARVLRLLDADVGIPLDMPLGHQQDGFRLSIFGPESVETNAACQIHASAQA